MATEIEVLLFDLGGVLVEFSGIQDVAPLLRVAASESEIRARWFTCRHTEAFGLGTLSREEFGERFVQDWGIDLPRERFLAEFRSWSRCLLPGAAELLASLRPRFRLAALSNSNELHWERNTDDLGVTSLFEVAISSHQGARTRARHEDALEGPRELIEHGPGRDYGRATLHDLAELPADMRARQVGSRY
jgi:glucose-1-phosphatase